MIKNISRKGLVFGTVAALALSSVSAAPAAFAATVGTGTAVATTYTGTGTSIVEGTDFDVTVFADPSKAYWSQTSGSGYAFTASTITKYTFTNFTADGFATSSYFQWLPTGSATVDTWSDNGENANDPAGVYVTASASASVATSVGFTASTSGNSVAAATPGQVNFSLTAGSITADTEVTYTPFISVDATGAFDAAAGDIAGAPITIKYLNNTGTLLTAALTGTVTGLTSQDIKATVTGPAGVNMTQMDDDLELLVSRSTVYVDDSNLTTNSSNVAESQTWNVSTGYYTARVWNFANDVAFSAATSEVIVGQITPDSKIEGISFVDVANANQTTNREVRAGTKSFDVSAQLLTADGSDDFADADNYAKSGVSVKFRASLNNSANADTLIKINGTTITDGGVDVTATTDANGVAKVTITSANGADNDAINISASVLSTGGNIIAYCGPQAWYWDTAAAENVWETHNVGYTDYVLATGKDSNVTLNYEVTDQFGQSWAKTGYEYQIRVTGSGIDYVQPLVNGKSSVTFPNLVGAGNQYGVTGTLEGREAGTTSWVPLGSDSNTIVVNQNNTVGSLSATVDFSENSDKKITYGDFITFNDNIAD